jgi:hypothetical protein
LGEWSTSILSSARQHGDAVRAEEIHNKLSSYVWHLSQWSKVLHTSEAIAAERRSFETSAEVLLQAFRASRLLCDKGKLAVALRRCLDAALPGLLDSAKVNSPVSTSTLKRLGLLVDCACVLREQDRNAQPVYRGVSVPYYRYGWSDSSPIHGRNWYISKHVRIQANLIVETFETAQLLALDRLHFDRRVLQSRKRKHRSALRCLTHVASFAKVVYSERTRKHIPGCLIASWSFYTCALHCSVNASWSPGAINMSGLAMIHWLRGVAYG